MCILHDANQTLSVCQICNHLPQPLVSSWWKSEWTTSFNETVLVTLSQLKSSHLLLWGGVGGWGRIQLEEYIPKYVKINRTGKHFKSSTLKVVEYRGFIWHSSSMSDYYVIPYSKHNKNKNKLEQPGT